MIGERALIKVTWQEVQAAVHDIVKKLLVLEGYSKIDFDDIHAIVYIPRGGAIPAAMLARDLYARHRLAGEMLPIMDINTYEQLIAVGNNGKCLLVDDIIERGDAFTRALQSCTDAIPVALYKKCSKDAKEIPDVIVGRQLPSGKYWLVFPWENISEEEIRSNVYYETDE